jgi:hypothetical protein
MDSSAKNSNHTEENYTLGRIFSQETKCLTPVTILQPAFWLSTGVFTTASTRGADGILLRTGRLGRHCPRPCPTPNGLCSTAGQAEMSQTDIAPALAGRYAGPRHT